MQTPLVVLETAINSLLTNDGAGFIYSTYLGGLDADYAYDLAAFSPGVPIIVGSTSSGLSFPWVNSLQRPTGPGGWSLVVKFDWLKGPLFSTSWGTGQATSVAVDKWNDIYFGGSSFSDLPLIHPILGSGSGFLAKLDPSGGSAHYSTPWTHSVRGVSVSIDTTRRMFAVGSTAGIEGPMPLVLPFDPAAGPGHSGFIVGVR